MQENNLVVYASRLLKPSERNYHTRDLELAAMVLHWKFYVITYI